MRHITPIDDFNDTPVLSLEQIRERIKAPDRELNIIIDRLTEYEDKGYEIQIDVCYYMIHGDEKLDTIVMAYCKYITGKGEAIFDFSDSVLRVDYARLEVINECFRDGRICYRIAFRQNRAILSDISDIYTEVCGRLNKVEVIGPEYISGDRLKFILVKCNM